MNIFARIMSTGLPSRTVIRSELVNNAILEAMTPLLDFVRHTLEKTPPELASDIIDTGIMLTGGGALLRGLDKLIAIETKMPVHIAENPLDCVVNGTGISLESNTLK